jgi:hypothetical protein
MTTAPIPRRRFVSARSPIRLHREIAAAREGVL